MNEWPGKPESKPRRGLVERWHNLQIGGKLAVVALAVLLGLAIGSAAAGGGAKKDDPAERARLRQYERECKVIVTQRIDTALYKIGGPTWRSKVLDCVGTKGAEYEIDHR